MKMTEEQVREFWRIQAIKYGYSYKASWTDKYAIDIEIKATLEELSGYEILDIGCANGFKTMKFAENYSGLFVGMDYIQEMIEEANKQYSIIRDSLTSSILFKTGNILNIDYPDGHFDSIVVSRVLINLPDIDRQVAAIMECSRVLKPGGRLIISEATLQGWSNLNSLRTELGLSVIPIPEFNTYLDEEKIFKHDYRLRYVKIKNISSTYFLGTRILKPLLISLLKLSEDPSNPESEINKLFSQFPPIGDYGTQKMFIMEKI